MASWDCTECYDTKTIDQGGAEIPCPYCQAEPTITVKITGLAHGLGEYGQDYTTMTAWTASTITFTGTRAAILADLASVERMATARRGSKGRQGSWATAIRRRARAAMAA